MSEQIKAKSNKGRKPLPPEEKKHYIKKEKPDYRKWIDEHREQILSIDPKVRVEYVQKHLNEDLKLNKTYYQIYQLLYRTKLIKAIETKDDNKNETKPTPKQITTTTIKELTNDVLKLCENDITISQELIQRYIKVLSNLNNDLEELKNIQRIFQNPSEAHLLHTNNENK